jgi:cell division protein FtsB
VKKPSGGIWDHLTRIVLGLLCLAGVLAIALWYWPLIRQNEAMRVELQRLEAEVEKERANSNTLEAALNSLLNDPREVERLGRETLGYARTGEVVIYFEAPVSNATVSARR